MSEEIYVREDISTIYVPIGARVESRNKKHAWRKVGRSLEIVCFACDAPIKADTARSRASSKFCNKCRPTIRLRYKSSLTHGGILEKPRIKKRAVFLTTYFLAWPAASNHDARMDFFSWSLGTDALRDARLRAAAVRAAVGAR